MAECSPQFRAVATVMTDPVSNCNPTVRIQIAAVRESRKSPWQHGTNGQKPSASGTRMTWRGAMHPGQLELPFPTIPDVKSPTNTHGSKHEDRAANKGVTAAAADLERFDELVRSFIAGLSANGEQYPGNEGGAGGGAEMPGGTVLSGNLGAKGHGI